MNTYDYLMIAVLSVLLCLCSTVSAQNFTGMEKKDLVKFSGSASLNLGYYEAFGIAPRRDRFSYLLGANINPQLLGIDIPLSATYSQQETTFLQPFNQVGFSPSYKNVTAHGGFRSLSYSSLTLGGHTFLGAGVDVKIPVKKGMFDYRVSAMYGRLRRAVGPAEAQIHSVTPSYKRMGYAASLGLISKKNAKNQVDFIFFKGYDVLNSIEAPVLNQEVKPEENLVLGLKGQLGFLKVFTLTADVAKSALSRDSRVEKGSGARGIFKATEALFTPNASTQYKNGTKLGVNYGGKKFSLGVKYNRIDPDYRTLGAYFFQNDVEDITLNGATSFFDKKANLSVSVGVQRNNLEEQQNTAQNRRIGSVNWTHALSDKLNYNLSFSNFSSALVVVQDVLSDSLNLYQLSTNYNAGISYGFGSDKLASRINLQGGHQIGNSRDEYSIQETSTKFYNAGLAYQLAIIPQSMTVQVALNYTLNQSPTMTMANVGPSISVGKKFKDLGLNLRYGFSYIKAGETANVYNNRVNANYKIGKKHKVKVGLGLMTRADSANDDNSFAELRGTTGYVFSF